MCVCVCVSTCVLLRFKEVIVRDPSSGWDLGPDLDHFSSRTRQVLQYMNPNKINMDLLVDLLDYLGNHIITVFKYVVVGFFSSNYCLLLCLCRQVATVCSFGWSCPGVPSRSGSYPAAAWPAGVRQEVQGQKQVWTQTHTVNPVYNPVLNCILEFTSYCEGVWPFLSFSQRYKIVALHSTLSSKDQAAAFTVPPPGVRKVWQLIHC